METPHRDTHSERVQWLRLIHAWNPALSDLERFAQARYPGRDLLGLDSEARSEILAGALEARSGADDRAVDADLAWLEGGTDRHLLCVTDPAYPWLLRQIPDPPLALFLLGDPACLEHPCLAIVGSRNPTPQGRETATRLGRALAGAGFVVVSGLARGIDGAAHQGALQAGTTAAVCGNGLDTIYPRAHRALGARVAAEGVLVSEFPPGTPPRRQHFPQRNRLISGLSLGTLVVEAGMRSGSLITARLAAEQNREVFAVPGSIQSPQSRGCHALLKKGATLVESVKDILAELGQFSDLRSGGDDAAHDTRSGDEWFLRHMGYAPCTRDELAKRSGLTSAEVSSMLLKLELEGCVELCPGGTYVRVNSS